VCVLVLACCKINPADAENSAQQTLSYMQSRAGCRSCAVANKYVLTIKGVGRWLTVFIAIANQTYDFALDW
jgi:hypothetical protein